MAQVGDPGPTVEGQMASQASTWVREAAGQVFPRGAHATVGFSRIPLKRPPRRRAVRAHNPIPPPGLAPTLFSGLPLLFMFRQPDAASGLPAAGRASTFNADPNLHFVTT